VCVIFSFLFFSFEKEEEGKKKIWDLNDSTKKQKSFFGLEREREGSKEKKEKEKKLFFLFSSSLLALFLSLSFTRPEEEMKSLFSRFSVSASGRFVCVNDPSAGSPTETLLRLLLPLNDMV
jgi:hypothetical protein